MVATEGSDLAGLISGLSTLAVTSEPPAELTVTVVDTPQTLGECQAALKGAALLALDCEGVNLNRLGNLTLVQLSTPSACFLIDVLDKPKSSEVVAFLKTILEDESLVKIIHDSKCDADSLLHQFGIRLQGVHDTQAWYEVLFPRAAALGLNDVLAAMGCPTAPRDKSLYATNPTVWETRPLTAPMIDRAAADVKGLFELQAKQVQQAGDQAGRCKSASDANLGKLRDGVARTIRINPSQAGKFVGRQGSNIRDLEKRLDVVFYGFGPKGSGSFTLFSKSEEAGDRALKAIARYM